MPSLTTLQKKDLTQLRTELQARYDAFKSQGLKLDMTRGKPCPEQLDLSRGLFAIADEKAADGTDCRNYGGVDGIAEARAFFASILGVAPAETIVGGNSSLQMMHDAIVRALLLGVPGGVPWSKQVKFLCPSPGYDRHFAICELYGIEMIAVAMRADGPDMDAVEKFAASDPAIKGIWCTPVYSNPEGVVYSDEVVRRFARMKTAAPDFRIFWDNAYSFHHIVENPRTPLNLLAACKEAGNPDRAYIFASTSKITFAGAGVAVMAASEANITLAKKHINIQTIGPDKLVQLRHVKFLSNADGVAAQMKKHAAILAPKFGVVLETLDRELAGAGVAEWNKPQGGYFVSVNVLDGTAKAVVQAALEAGVLLTKAGATFPYGKDPGDRNIRIAPSFPSVADLGKAMELFCVCVKLEAVKKLGG